MTPRNRILTTAFSGCAMGLALGGPSGVSAASLTAASKISAVTVFPDAALIRRELNVEIPAGSHDIVVPGLPEGIDAASLRVEGMGSAKFRIGGIDFRTAPKAPGSDLTDIGTKLKALRLDLDRLTDRIEAVEGRKAMVNRLTTGSPESKERPTPDLETWLKGSEAVGKALLAVNDELRGLRIEETRINAEIEALEAAESERHGTATQKAVVIAVESAGAGTATLTLSYRITGASWRPVYDAHLTIQGQTPKLELVSRAMIRQSTGEDWTDVKVELSTQRVRSGTAAPTLWAEKIAIYERPPTPPAAPMPRAAPAPAPTAMMAEADGAGSGRKKKASPGRAEQTERATQTPVESVSSAFATSFLVQGLTSLPANGAEKSVFLGSSTPDAKLSLKTNPVVDTTAYLETRFIAPKDANLLGGEVLLHRDNAFVGKGRMKATAPGDQVELGFGPDDKVVVTRVPMARDLREPGLLGSTKTDDVRFRTLVRNRHAFPVEVTILDRFPISEEQVITIERLPDQTKPDVETIDDRRGTFAWKPTLKPDEERAFVTAFRVRWPAGKEIRRTQVAN